MTDGFARGFPGSDALFSGALPKAIICGGLFFSTIQFLQKRIFTLKPHGWGLAWAAKEGVILPESYTESFTQFSQASAVLGIHTFGTS